MTMQEEIIDVQHATNAIYLTQLYTPTLKTSTIQEEEDKQDKEEDLKRRTGKM